MIPKGLDGLNKAYGVPYDSRTQLNPTWRAANIVSMELPYLMRLAWDPETKVSKIAIHRDCVTDLTKILAEVWHECRIDAKKSTTAPEGLSARDLTKFWDEQTYKVVGRYGLDLYGGAFNFRKKRGTKWWGARALSTHSWGCAIDIDPEHNGMGNANYRMPAWVIQIFEKYGWVAGARWKGKGVDAMHFQRATGV